MALPGESNIISPPQRFRLAIGETYEKNGRSLPRKMDYWTVRRLSVQSGKAPTYITDADAQRMMCGAANAPDKPVAIPVSMIGNPDVLDGMPTLPESILWARMARYSGGKCCCSCKDFDAEGKGTATERVFSEKKTQGQYPKTYYVLEATRERPCDPEVCPYATGDHDQLKYKGTPLCKPQVVLSVGLPWYPVVGTVAKFKTTGWHSYRALRDSLLAIALQTGGWLHDLPNLWLVLDWELAGNGQLVPSVRVEYRGQVAQLREMAASVQGRWLKQEDQLKQLQSGVVALVVDEEEDPKEQAAHQAEFAPEGYDLTPPVIDGEFEAEWEAPAVEDEPGEPLVLQQPPVSPKQVTDLESFNAAMIAVGVTTPEQLSAIKDQLGYGGITRAEMELEQLRAVYSQALSEWEANNA